MSETTGATPSRSDLRRVLSQWDATALIVGIMIGSGIFATPPLIAASLDRFGPMIAIWLVGGVLAICGALTYAEPAAMFPRTGGTFVFLHEAYGPMPAFVYGWSALLITYPASIAAVAVVFAAYLARLVPNLPVPQPVVAAVLSLVLCGLNARGVVLGARVQFTATAAKVAALLILVGVAIASGAGEWGNLTPILSAPSGGWHLSALALALASVMWTYEGWANGPTLSGEVRDIRRDLPRALLIGTGLVAVIYILVNTAYVSVLSIPGIAASDSVAVDMATRGLGAFGGVFVNVLVLVSTLGCVNGMAISGSRVFFAMGRAGLFFEAVGRVHRRFITPANALAILGVVSATYCLLGTFEQIIRYFVFVSTIWYVLVCGSVYVLRHRRPNQERSFRVPLYPVTPAVFLLVALGLMYQLLLDNTRDSLIGVAIISISVPFYLLWRRWRRSPS